MYFTDSVFRLSEMHTVFASFRRLILLLWFSAVPLAMYGQVDTGTTCGKAMEYADWSTVLYDGGEYAGTPVEAFEWDGNEQDAYRRIAVISQQFVPYSEESPTRWTLFLQVFNVDGANRLYQVLIDSVQRVLIDGDLHYMQSSFIVADADKNGREEYYYTYTDPGGDEAKLTVRLISDSIRTFVSSIDPVYGSPDYDVDSTLFLSHGFASLPTEIQRFALGYRDRVMHLRKIVAALWCRSR